MSAFVTLIAVCAYFALSFLDTAQSNAWRGIVPLVSDREDVERLLGPCSQKNPLTCLYETENEIISVSLSDGPCEKGWPFGYDVPSNTVLRVEVSPRKHMPVSELRLNEDRYKKKTNRDGSVMYISDEDGIAVWVFDGKVGSFIYGSSSKQSHLRCPDSVSEMPKGAEIADAHSRFAAYGDISLDDERDYLDGFAKILNQQSTVQGYIITYAGQRSSVNEAGRRLQCQRDYLIRKRGVDPGHITTIDGGYHSSRNVELYVLLRGGPVPVPYPSIRPSQVEIVKENGVVATSLCSVPRAKFRP